VLVDEETEFWQFVARKGLPRFRWLRRPLRPEQLDDRFRQTQLEGQWLQLRETLLPDDEIWPFSLASINRWGFRKGFVVLRSGEAIGGIICLVS
jgi:hypothetical protein